MRCAFRYEVKIEKIVPPTVFHPAPEVESALVKLVRRPAGELDASPEELKRVSSLAGLLFSQRRKQMGKILASSYGRENVEKALEQTGLTWETRPDKVPYTKFIELAQILGDMIK